ncbi:NAD-dependent epimerase/dehydratase family protein [Paenibacillus lutimineralis]|uniref:NAD-dependent epimerase/dehydratase family protein n=1 Tax=Paenibacillus lutimineralis TaxID=2707005 RepID=A0A3S9UTP5_9BACL|nr:NAD-dependent epimerase/dehydratase family protein [Paenibacillus lutimineralis]AZS13644.1 NAD-dependent epimerase/dehydratase family protein [Paenibacillus lutimineralis]
MKEVFVLGGTGFLGFYTTKELLKKGYSVSTVALPPMPAEDLLPSEVQCTLADINEMTDEQVVEMLKGKYAFIYAAGADERVVPAAPAMKFFYEANVLPTQRMARLAKQAGVKKFVVFGSYFSHFAEVWTDLDLKRNNGYPRTRLLQEEVAFMEGEGTMDVMSLRLPYIFGVMPGRMPLWTMFVEQVKGKDIVPVLDGGTAMVTVQQVAEAAVGAIEHGTHRSCYAISDTNMKFTEFNQMIVDMLGQTETKVTVVPLETMKSAMEQMDAAEFEAGREHGIHLADTMEIQNRDAYLDPEDTMPILQYKKDDVRAAIRETLQKCIEGLQ